MGEDKFVKIGRELREIKQSLNLDNYVILMIFAKIGMLQSEGIYDIHDKIIEYISNNFGDKYIKLYELTEEHNKMIKPGELTEEKILTIYNNIYNV